MKVVSVLTLALLSAALTASAVNAQDYQNQRYQRNQQQQQQNQDACMNDAMTICAAVRAGSGEGCRMSSFQQTPDFTRLPHSVVALARLITQARGLTEATAG